MTDTKKNFEKRFPAYLGGLLLGLAAMLGIFQIKKAMMPKFHEVQEDREEVAVAPSGGVRIVYSDDPSYFLIPGFPTAVLVSHREEDGSYKPLLRVPYGSLLEKDPLIGPLGEEGIYSLDANFYICPGPGAAECTKLSLHQGIRVDRSISAVESRLDLNLSQLSRIGSDASKTSEGEKEKQ